MTVARICSREVAVASPTASLVAVAKVMRDRNVGTVVVVDATKRPVGIVTDRDLVTRVLAGGADAGASTVEAVMTRCPRTMPTSAAATEALACMRELGVRRLPVVGTRGELVGIVSVDDVLQSVAEELGSLSLVIAHSVGGTRLPRQSGEGSRHGSTQVVARASGDPEC